MNNYIIKKLPNRKVLLLFLMITACFVLPVKAQKNDFFFHGDALYENRNAEEENGYYNLYNQQFGSEEYGGYNLYNQQFGAEVPLGGGILIMLGAGICYTVIKRKNIGL